jgi:hypothetical protein
MQFKEQSSSTQVPLKHAQEIKLDEVTRRLNLDGAGGTTPSEERKDKGNEV